jgi:hypothetical protein
MEFEFGKSGTVETLDVVPEQFRGLYAAGEGGKFVLNPASAGIATAIDGLNGALRNERKSNAALRSQKDVSASLKEHLGFDTIEDAKAKLEELTAAVASKANVDPAKLKADIEKGFIAKEDGYKADKAKMQATLDKYLVESAGLSALAELKGNSKLLMPIIKAQAVVVADGDEYVVRVKDAAGDYRGNTSGGFMTVADLVKELKASADYGVAFASEAPSGGGKPSGQLTRPSRETQQRQSAAGDVPKTPNQLISDGLAARRRADG